MGMSWRAIIAALGTAAELVRSAKNLRETVSELDDRRKALPGPTPSGVKGILASVPASALDAT